MNIDNMIMIIKGKHRLPIHGVELKENHGFNKLATEKKNRVAPAMPPLGWNGFENKPKHYDLMNYSVSLAKSTLTGLGIGGLLGLTYGFWDYNDEKKLNKIKGIDKEVSKDIIIRDTLIGAGIGGAVGLVGNPLVNSIKNALNDRKANAENKKLFDNLLHKVSGNMDKKKAEYFVNLHKDGLTESQYNALLGLAGAGRSGGNQFQRSFNVGFQRIQNAPNPNPNSNSNINTNNIDPNVPVPPIGYKIQQRSLGNPKSNINYNKLSKYNKPKHINSKHNKPKKRKK